MIGAPGTPGTIKVARLTNRRLGSPEEQSEHRIRGGVMLIWFFDRAMFKTSLNAKGELSFGYAQEPGDRYDNKMLRLC
mgnify:CR=1 FL=1